MREDIGQADLSGLGNVLDLHDPEEQLADSREQLAVMREIAGMLAEKLGEHRLANRCRKMNAHHAMEMAKDVVA